MSAGEQDDKKAEALQADSTAQSEDLRSTLQEIRHDSEQRLGVVDGLSEVKAGRVQAGEKFRYLVTAAVQAHPREIGTWLDGEGAGFATTDRPVNTSLIDQDHSWTFEGNNGFILEPPVNPDDVIAARPHDFASNDLISQPIEQNAEELLSATSPEGYNQITICSGKLAGVFIKFSPDGAELGDPVKNQQLREFAQEHDVPLVEIEVEPQELRTGPVTMERLPANSGNQLWKMRMPEEGSLREIDIIKFQPGEAPRGFTIDESGFDMRLQEIDGYGQSRYVLGDAESVQQVLARIDELSGSMDEADQSALAFARHRLEQALQS